MAQTIQLRRGTAAAWTAANPTLAVGELGAETDTGKVKVGNGTQAWNALAYLTSTGAAWGAISGSIASQADLVAALAAKLDAAAHAADTDPHPVYLTQTEGNALYQALASLAESIDDRVAALLVAGANITLTYNDASNTLTIAASGGAGATNLTFSRDGTTVTVLSDTGTDAVLPAVDATNAGVATAAQKATWDAKADALASVTLTAATNLVRGTHGNRLIICNSATPFTLTIEDDTTGAWADSDALLLLNIGAGLVTLAGDGTSTITAGVGYKLTIPQNTVGGAVRSGANAWRSTTPKAHASAGVALTDGANIALDASLSNTYYVVLGGNRTLDNPTNPSDGQVINVRIRQDATGSRTLAYGTKYWFPGGTDPVLSTAANAVDLMSCQYDATLDAWLCNTAKAYA